MAIKKEFYKVREDGTKLYRQYSDANLRIRKAGTVVVYDEAIDVESATFEYEETDEQIGGGDDSETATTADYQNALKEMGVE